MSDRITEHSCHIYDDVLADDGGIYKEHTDIAIDVEFLNEEESYEELSDVEISLEIVGGICENAV